MKSKYVLNKIVNVCDKAVGERQKQLSQLYEQCVVRKARMIVEDNSHVLAKHYELLPSGRRFRVPKSNTNLQSIAFLNREICSNVRAVCVCLSVGVCKLCKLLVYYIIFGFSITVL